MQQFGGLAFWRFGGLTLTALVGTRPRRVRRVEAGWGEPSGRAAAQFRCGKGVLALASGCAAPWQVTSGRAGLCAGRRVISRSRQQRGISLTVVAMPPASFFLLPYMKGVSLHYAAVMARPGPALRF